MFKTNKTLKQEVKDLKSKNKQVVRDKEWYKKENKELKEVEVRLIKEQKEEIEDLKREHAMALVDQSRQLTQDSEDKVRTIKETARVETIKLTKENAVLTEKVSILEASFKNMGFDVKDMKGILDGLVKGIVAKNDIKIISTK